jgi:hypothetical protein
VDVTSTAGLELLDPTAERESGDRPLAASLSPGGGRRLAFMDIRKPRGSQFLDELERLLTAEGFVIERTAKPTFTRPAPADLRREIAERCDGLVEALAD